MWTSPDAVSLTDEQRRTLEAWVAARTTPQRLAFRARIILLASTGASNRQIARQVQTSRPTVILWRQRFGAGGVAAPPSMMRSSELKSRVFHDGALIRATTIVGTIKMAVTRSRSMVSSIVGSWPSA